MTEQCKHEWSTRYLRSTLGDCIEIYCIVPQCKKKMTWKEAKRRLNKVEQSPSIKVSDGDVWLVFPDASVSIEGLLTGGTRGPIVKKNIRKWRDALLTKEQSNVR